MPKTVPSRDRHSRLAASRFDEWAETYGEDRLSMWFKHYQSFALSKLALSHSCGFLDVGCGTGEAVRIAAQQLNFGKACGIDISPKMIEKAKIKHAHLHNAEFRIASAEAIPYPDESFSSILCTCSLHHYPRPVDALAEMRRVLKKDGQLIILDSARDVSLAIWLQDRWRRYLERSHVAYYTSGELQGLISTAGFRLAKPAVTIKRFMFKQKMFTGLVLLQCVKAEHVEEQRSDSHGRAAEQPRMQNTTRETS